jgi:hypothetical protein
MFAPRRSAPCRFPRRDEDKAVAPGAVLDGVGRQGDRLHGGHCQFPEPAGLEPVHPGIVPNVRSRSAVLVGLEGIDVWCSAVLPHEYEFKLGAVKCSHPRVGLVPNAEVLELRSASPEMRQRGAANVWESGRESGHYPSSGAAPSL